MPQKRNSTLCGEIITIGAEIRTMVPLALEAVIQSHEVPKSPPTELVSTYLAEPPQPTPVPAPTPGELTQPTARHY